MEFRYRDAQIKRTPSPLHPSLLSNHPLQAGDLTPRVFPVTLPINANQVFQPELENEKIWREIEKEKIRREIMAREMALAFREPVLISTNGVNNVSMFGGPQFHLPSQASMQINKDNSQFYNKQPFNNKLIILDRADDHCGGKRKVAIDDSESLVEKKVRKEWSCELCQITATSEKGLNDHIQGKKHKAKEASIRTSKIGLDSRPEVQTLDPCLTPTNTCKLESKEKDRVLHKSNGVVGALEIQNEIINTSKQAGGETSALPKIKRFKFWCAFCQVGTQSEIVMQSHKNGKRHLTNIKFFNQIGDGATNHG